MDDLTVFEIILISNVGIATHNLTQNVPTNIPLHNQVVPNEHHRSQEYLEKIADWTDQKKMVLNEKTSKAMIFNFSKKYQFTTNLKLKGDKLKVLK